MVITFFTIKGLLIILVFGCILFEYDTKEVDETDSSMSADKKIFKIILALQKAKRKMFPSRYRPPCYT